MNGEGEGADFGGGAALVAAAAALAGGGVIASASGGYGFTGTAAGSFFDVQPFTVDRPSARRRKRPRKFAYTQVRDGV